MLNASALAKSGCSGFPVSDPGYKGNAQKGTKMQFIDLGAQFQALGPQIRRRIDQVLANGAYIMGPEVGQLQRELAAYCGVKHAIGCANGTDALVLALRALGIGPGDTVATTPFTFFATAEAIVLVGARPLFVDIAPVTFNIDPQALEAAILSHDEERGGRLRAVMGVDLFGLPADYDAIEPLCRAHGLFLIEDAAQGFGGAIGSRVAGSFGDIAITSFFPAKPLGCYGDGGAVFTNDDELAATVRSLHVHGKGADKYDNVLIGTNSRLDTIQAAILLEKLAVFPVELDARQRVAEAYARALDDVVGLPRVPGNFRSSWAQYSVLAPSAARRTEMMAALAAANIPTAIYYAKPLHFQPALAELGYQEGAFPVAEDVAARIFSLPMGPYLDPADQALVIDALKCC
jgi:UDP-2-acetamido-2-deoxy-ribo-hexuluronate aminotransferase